MIEIITLSKRLWMHLDKKRRSIFYLIVFLTLISAFLELVLLASIIPFVKFISSPENFFLEYKKFIFFSNKNFNSVVELQIPLVIFYCSLFLSSAVLKVFLINIQLKYSFMIGQDFGSRIYTSLLEAPYESHLYENSSNSISSLFNKVNVTIKGAIFPLMSIFTSTFLLLSIFSGLLYLSPVFSSVILIISVVLYLSFSSINKNTLRKNGLTISVESSRLIKLIQESLAGIRNIIIDNSHEFFIDDFNHTDYLFRKSQYKNSFISMYPKYIVETIAILSIIIFSIFIANKSNANVGNSNDILSVVAILIIASQRMIPYVQQVYNSFSLIRGDFASVTDILDLLDKAQTIRYFSNKKIKFMNSFNLKDIYFKYKDSNSLVLSDVNLKITAGEWIAIVGASGSGKSTLIDIILGLLTPKEGKLIVDGETITSKNLKSWQSQIGHVPQNVFISDSSILNNIALGYPKFKIDMDRIILCSKIVELHDFFMSLEQGYLSVVGENGATLSGGQKQRIGIARALYKNCKILILDEPTSSLDEEMQKKVIKNIKLQGGGYTVIIITHSAANTKFCDKIYKLQKSKLYQLR